MRILVVEDEHKVAADICNALKTHGYMPEVASDGEDAWFRGETEDYAAAVLDLGLPGMDGISILKRWREAAVTMPVLILTARGSWSERVDGIDAGADDYLPKPFQIEELLARIRAILRRTAGHASSVIQVKHLKLDQRQMRVSCDGAPVSLSPLEYRVLAYLVHNCGRIVPQHELTEHVYGGDADRDNNTLEVLVGRVRRKIGKGLIETQRGFGYIVRDDIADEGP